MLRRLIVAVVGGPLAALALAGIVGIARDGFDTSPTAALAQSGPALDRFQCYKAKASSGFPRFVAVAGVSLGDAVSSQVVDVKAPQVLCNPANLDSQDPTAPTHAEHLESYKIKRAQGQPKFVKVLGQTVVDSWGSLTVDLKKPARLMVPSAKMVGSVPPPLVTPVTDHFTCYGLTITKGTPKFVPILGVQAEDQFGATVMDVKKPTLLCLATDRRPPPRRPRRSRRAPPRRRSARCARSAGRRASSGCSSRASRCSATSA